MDGYEKPSGLTSPFIRVCVRLSCGRVCVHVCMCVCVCVCVCMYACMHVCVCVYASSPILSRQLHVGTP